MFQKMANWIKSIKTPAWLVSLGDILQSVVKDTFQILGKEATDFLKSEIFKQATRDIPGKDKAKNVYNAFKDQYKEVEVSDRIINLAIELLLSQLVESKIVK